MKPNEAELQLGRVLDSLFPGEYRYVGDFSFWIDGKNPDFVNVNGKKKIVELFGDYWHKKEDEGRRVQHFKRFGFDTLIVWQSELGDIEKLKEKLVAFHKRGL